MAGALFTLLGWLGFRLASKRRRKRVSIRAYARLPGSDREGMMGIYRRVEKLLRKRGVQPRGPGETLGEYAQLASERLGETDGQLSWFTEAAWSAAYDPAPFPARLLPEAQARLASLKAALG